MELSFVISELRKLLKSMVHEHLMNKKDNPFGYSFGKRSEIIQIKLAIEILEREQLAKTKPEQLPLHVVMPAVCVNCGGNIELVDNIQCKKCQSETSEAKQTAV